ncbi:MAG: HAD family hydrolase [Candidatus ainarchaeum sp.]|nr:HAD family hydrolase [Candidatus ainarchaeum sp.]
MIKLVIFDLWRTLIPATIDFNHLFSLITKKGFSKEKFIEDYENAVQLKEYNSLEELKKDFFLTFRHVEGVDLGKEFYEIYTNRFDKINFFPDVKKNLLNVKNAGFKMALLSNTESLLSKKIEDKLKLNDYFDFLGYSFEINFLKPDKRAFDFVLNKFNVKPSEAVMVGDSLRSDIAGAKNAGMFTIQIDRENFVLDEANVKPDFKISSFDELIEKLGYLNEKKS